MCQQLLDIQFEPLTGEIEVKMKESVRDTRLDQKETHRLKFQRSVVEIDCFDLELHTQHGTWAIPIRITDFSSAQGGQAVSVGDVCGRVSESYGYLWGSGKLSIALECLGKNRQSQKLFEKLQRSSWSHQTSMEPSAAAALRGEDKPYAAATAKIA